MIESRIDSYNQKFQKIHIDLSSVENVGQAMERLSQLMGKDFLIFGDTLNMGIIQEMIESWIIDNIGHDISAVIKGMKNISNIDLTFLIELISTISTAEINVVEYMHRNNPGKEHSHNLQRIHFIFLE